MHIGLKKEKILWMAGEITLARRRIREALFLMEHDEDRKFFESCYQFEKSSFKEYNKFYLFEDRSFLRTLREGDHDAINEAITFLDASPYCFRSGFIKKKLCRALAHAPLDREERHQLRRIIIDALNTQRPVSFKDFAALACPLYTPGFHARIKKLEVIPFKYILSRKKYLLQRLEEAEKNFVPPPEPQHSPPPPSVPHTLSFHKKIIKRLLEWIRQIAAA